MKMRTLHDLFVDQLKDLYNAEHQIIKALPKMAKAAASDELRSGFEQHLGQTRQQVERLEQIFGQLEMSHGRKKCKAMEGLIEEGKELMEEDVEEDVLDAGLIAAAQKVEHYEIAGYGCARTWAQQLGMREAADLLQQTLEEEKATDEKLTRLAVSRVNREAEDGARGEGEQGDRELIGAGMAGRESQEGSLGQAGEGLE
jgi:ferritin-like metal-binding protein YciE